MMPLLLLAAAGLVASLGPTSVANLPRNEAVAVLVYGAALAWLTGWAVERSRPSWRDAIGATLMWAVFVTSLTGLYVRREQAIDGLRAMVEDLGIGDPVATVTGSGEVSVTRRSDGTFRVMGLVNGHPAGFMFDTGASTLVLTNETALRLGFRQTELKFRVPVSTANGSSLAAPVDLDSLAVGPIVLSRVRALVVAPGLLQENLLGQSVLSRLDSYEVRGNRLVLRAGKG